MLAEKRGKALQLEYSWKGAAASGEEPEGAQSSQEAAASLPSQGSRSCSSALCTGPGPLLSANCLMSSTRNVF